MIVDWFQLALAFVRRRRRPSPDSNRAQPGDVRAPSVGFRLETAQLRHAIDLFRARGWKNPLPPINAGLVFPPVLVSLTAGGPPVLRNQRTPAAG